MKIVVLGSGLIGSAMTADLAKDGNFEMVAADLRKESLISLEREFGVKTVQADLSKAGQISELIEGCDLVINAVPGFMGYQVFKTVIENGKNIVDIAFFPEDPFDLDELAKRNQVIAVMDCGVAPGLSNMMVGASAGQLDSVENATIYVGGLPVERHWPYEYKIVFSAVDVIEEYTRPARYIENGRLVTRPALSDPEFLDFPGIGTLEAFNTDGLRTLMKTVVAPNLKEKTLRYPGHIEKMAVLRETGFFDKEPIDIAGTQIRPLDFTARLLFPMWKLKEGEQDFTVMRVVVDGTKDGRKIRFKYDLLDRFDTTTATTSMARTTGYTATSTARLILDGKFTTPGVIAPELVGAQPGCMNYVKDKLAERNVIYRESQDFLSD